MLKKKSINTQTSRHFYFKISANAFNVFYKYLFECY